MMKRRRILRTIAIPVMLVCSFFTYASVIGPYQETVLSKYKRHVPGGLRMLAAYGENPHPILTSAKDTVFVIMPTHSRQNQRAVLVMQTQILSMAKGIHLIMAEDSQNKTQWIHDLLEESQIPFTQLQCTHPKNCSKPCGKGWAMRNCALRWLNQTGVNHGVLYFADDDNFYDVRLFDEIKKTKTVSLFPVGGFLYTWISAPIVKNGSIIDFMDSWKGGRKWPVDMAGFALSLPFWRKRKWKLFSNKAGFLETKFLESLNITRDDVQVLASGGKDVYVWHNSLRPHICNYATMKEKNKWNGTNFDELKSKFLMCVDRKVSTSKKSKVVLNKTQKIAAIKAAKMSFYKKKIPTKINGTSLKTLPSAPGQKPKQSK